MALRHLTTFILWFILIYWHTSADSLSQGINGTTRPVKSSSFDQQHELFGQWQQYYTFPRRAFHLQKEFFNSVHHGFKKFNGSYSEQLETYHYSRQCHQLDTLWHTNEILMTSSWNNVASSNVNMTLVPHLIDKWPEPALVPRQPQQIMQLAHGISSAASQHHLLPAPRVSYA